MSGKGRDEPEASPTGDTARDDRQAAPTGELAAIGRLTARLGDPPEGELWIGDDCAVVATPGPMLLMAADTLVEGVHADLRWSSPADLGWKAMAVNVSDVAAMGGTPHRAVVSVAAPAGTDLDALYDGIAEAAARYRCPVVGGDLTSSPVLVVTVAVTGSIPDGGAPVTRAGAVPGDRVWVTGPTGSAAAGLRLLGRGTRDGPLVSAHRRPQARVAEGTVARLAGATAMIDVSDGLGLDLWRLARASGVGVELDSEPVAEGATREETLGGGDDYELVFTVPEVAGAAVVGRFEEAGLRAPLAIGRCTAGEPGRLVLRGEVIAPTGWEHRL